MAERKETAWDFIQPWDIQRFGDIVTNTDEQKRWSGAVYLAGGLPYMWSRKAGVVKELIYDKLELQQGDRVLIVGEAVVPSGFLEDIRGRVGADTEVRVIDFIDEARSRALLIGKRGRGTWDYNYTSDMPEGYFDCVGVLQGVQHSEDWRKNGAELLRVIKPGRRIVMAEIAFGPEFDHKMHSDLHIETILEKIVYGYGTNISTIPYWGQDELAAAFDGLVDEPEIFSWKGIELFWGRKPA